jgi:uncharacterized protein
VQRVTPAQWVAQPWKNGGGITHEIVRWGAGTTSTANATSPVDPASFAVRVSMATVERSGPFSTFPGYTRWTYLAGDAPVELRAGATTYRLTAIGDHICVPGELAMHAELAGPTHLFNVLALPGVPVRFAFALVDTPELPRWHGVRDPEAIPPVPPGCVWIA